MIQFSNKWTCFFVTRGHLFCDTRTVSHQNWCTPLNLTNMSHIFSSNHKNIEIMKNHIDFDNMECTWCSSNMTFHKGQKWPKKWVFPAIRFNYSFGKARCTSKGQQIKWVGHLKHTLQLHDHFTSNSGKFLYENNIFKPFLAQKCFISSQF